MGSGFGSNAAGYIGRVLVHSRGRRAGGCRQAHLYSGNVLDFDRRTRDIGGRVASTCTQFPWYIAAAPRYAGWMVALQFYCPVVRMKREGITGRCCWGSALAVVIAYEVCRGGSVGSLFRASPGLMTLTTPGMAGSSFVKILNNCRQTWLVYHGTPGVTSMGLRCCPF